VLEAGCGGGGNFEELALLGPVKGLEPSRTAVEVARRRGLAEVVAGRIESMPFENGEFDVATALDVIEHTDDDVVALRELRRVVRPGGFLVVTVPAYPALWGPHDVANEHRRRYVRRTLVGPAVRAGWSPSRVTYFNTILLPLATLRRLWERTRNGRDPNGSSDFDTTPPWLDRPLELPLRAEARLISSGRNLPAGLSLLGLFEATSEQVRR
jgi:SAM-dependent methyltransferase